MLSTHGKLRTEIMKKSEFKKVLYRAINAQSKLDGECAKLSIMFQPFFNVDVFVLYQQSDGFVVCWDDGDNEPHNEGCNEVFENIKADENYYK